MHKNVKRCSVKMSELDLDRLHEVLDYDPETGVLSWRVRLSPRCRIGEQAGKIDQKGYRRISIDKVNYPASHLAWFHFYGETVEEEIDFENLDKLDLRITNLREATRAENMRNNARNSSNTTAYKGVARFNNPGNRAKYRSAIRVGDKRIFLGLFHTPEEAYTAYCAAVKKYHGKFARVS